MREYNNKKSNQIAILHTVSNTRITLNTFLIHACATEVQTHNTCVTSNLVSVHLC